LIPLFFRRRLRVNAESLQSTTLKTSGTDTPSDGFSAMEDTVPAREINLMSFMDNLPGWAWIKDPSGRYCFVNSKLAKAGCLEAAKWLGKRHTDIVAVSLAGDAHQSDRLVLEEGRSICEIEPGREGGKPCDFLVNRFPILTSRGKMIGGIAIDLTDRVRQERRMAEAREQVFHYERARLTGQISSSLAHGLNNTLNAITLRLLSLMKTEPALGEDHPSLQRLTALVEDAAARVRRLQEFSRLQRDRPLVGLNLAAVINDAIYAVQARMAADPHEARASRRISLEETPSDLSAVLGMVPDVYHLFVNLFLYADGIMPTDGWLRVAIQCDRIQATVTIEAHGAILAEQVWAGFLYPFGIAEPNNEVSGTNVRLSMAETLMVQLGGTIEIERPGEVGSNYKLKLGFPMMDSYQSIPPREAGVRKKRRSCQNLLVIDDDSDNLEEMKAVLELRGYRVRTASSGVEGLRTLATETEIDAVVCDLGMPGMNGWEVAREIALSTARIPVYLVTGWADGITVGDPRRSLVTAVLGKPINLPELETLLRGVGAGGARL
jgi:CheY-like chemotaxis protein/signal transduction histidine kinase